MTPYRMEHINLDLFIAYDLKYSKAKSSHYTNVKEDLLDLINDVNIFGSSGIQKEVDYLLGEKAIDEKEAHLFFGNGYAAKCNAILY